MKKHYNITVEGRVQGVMFRAAAKAKAEELGLFGIARNNENGSIYFEIEGSFDLVEKFIRWCHVGPKHAQIEKIITQPGVFKNYSLFRVVG